MKKVYQPAPKSRLNNMTTYSEITGEVGNTIIALSDYTDRKYPNKGYNSMYVNKLEGLMDLSKTAQRLFFAIIKNVDEWNRIIGRWKDFTDDPVPNISKAKKELMEAGFIAKLGKAWVLNPYIVLPRYQKNYMNSQYEVQQIWTRYVEDMNAYYDGIDDDAEELYNVKLQSE